MKIIHCADIHIDSSMKSNLMPVQTRDRRREVLLSFERMVEYANQNDVRVIIIAGDMFDTTHIAISTKKRIFDIIAKYQNIDFLYLSGNHDEDVLISELNDNLDNLKVFNDEWTNFNYSDIVITGAKKCNDVSLELLSLDANKFNIVTLHGQISKYNVTSDDEIISLPKLKNKNVDYLALGHIHSFDSAPLDDRGVYAYSGCLEGRGFDECGKKGFVLLDITDGKCERKFIPFASRELLVLEFDITDFDNWYDIENEIIKKLENIDKNNLIKIVLKGKYSLNLNKNIDLFTKRVNETFYYVKIKDESTLKIEAKDIENDKSLRGEFIRQVMNSTLSDEEKERVIILGVKALDGEVL